MPPAGSRRSKTPRSSWRAAAGVFALIAFGVGIWWFATSPLFQLKEFRVVGTKRLESAAIAQTLQQLYAGKRFGIERRNVFLAPFWQAPSSTEQTLKAMYPELAAAAIETLFPHTLTIVVRERGEAVLWCRAERPAPPTPPADATSTAPLLIPAAGTQDITGCAWIDREGVAFRSALASEGALITTVKDYRSPALRLGSSVADPRLVADILTVNAASEREFGFPVNAFTVLAEIPDDLVAYGPTGFRIIIPRGTLLNRQLAALGRFFAQEIAGDYSKILEYVDARIENRVYYK